MKKINKSSIVLSSLMLTGLVVAPGPANVFAEENAVVNNEQLDNKPDAGPKSEEAPKDPKQPASNAGAVDAKASDAPSDANKTKVTTYYKDANNENIIEPTKQEIERTTAAHMASPWFIQNANKEVYVITKENLQDDSAITVPEPDTSKLTIDSAKDTEFATLDAKIFWQKEKKGFDDLAESKEYTFKYQKAETKTKEFSKELDFNTIYRANPELDKGVEKVVAEGTKGKQTKTLTLAVKLDDQAARISRELSNEDGADNAAKDGLGKYIWYVKEVAENTVKALDRIIEVGTKPTVETVEEKDGDKTITYTITTPYSMDEKGKVTAGTPVKAKAKEVVPMLKLTEATVVSKIPFDIEFIDSDDLEVGVSEIVTAGVDGIKETTGDVEKIVKEPIKEVIKIGTKAKAEKESVKEAEKENVKEKDGDKTVSSDKKVKVVAKEQAKASKQESVKGEKLPQTGEHSQTPLYGMLASLAASTLLLLGVKRKN